MNCSIRSVLEAIAILGHDEDFFPTESDNWWPTDAVAGSTEKVNVLRARVESGMPLFHPQDNPYCKCSLTVTKKLPTIRVVRIRNRRSMMLSE